MAVLPRTVTKPKDADGCVRVAPRMEHGTAVYVAGSSLAAVPSCAPWIGVGDPHRTPGKKETLL
jgi:hypothetical protein